MAEFYVMPSASPTMELGMLVAWTLSEGDSFKPQAVVAEIGTDKANMEAEIFDAGVMIKHLVAEGDEVPAGFPIAIVGQSADEDITALVADFEAQKKALDAGESAEEPAAAEAPAAVAAPAPSAPSKPPEAPKKRQWMGKELPPLFQDVPGDIRAATTEDRVAASPLARRVADDLGVQLKRVQGSGPGGRIVKADVEDAAKRPAPSGGAVARASSSVLNTPMRKTIARRLLESHQDIPTFFLTATFDVAGFVALRKQLKSQLPDLRVSYNDMLIMAVARALREHPEVNASWGDKHTTQHGSIDVGVAVALPEGLITPVLRGTDNMTLSQVAGAVRDLAGRAKAGKLQPEDYTGGTFTISNLGMFGIDHFTAIINPPEAGILAVGGINQVPVVVDGQLTTGWRMKVTMTCDHRVIDGAVGATFLKTLRKYVESPSLLLV